MNYNALIDLINYSCKEYDKKLDHYSSYRFKGEGVEIYLYENCEGFQESYLYSSKEYWEVLKKLPEVLDSLGKYEREHLKEIIGENKDIVFLDKDYALSTGYISYYIFYNFNKIEVDLKVESRKCSIYLINKSVLDKEALHLPFDEAIRIMDFAKAIFSDEEEDLDLTRCHCTKCNHTYYVQGVFDNQWDSCIYCRTSEFVRLEGQEDKETKVS